MTSTRNQRPAIWCAVIVCAYSLAPAATIALGDTGSIPRDAIQWQPTEWTVSHPGDVANPFDVQAQVVFEHGESGERRVTEMFTTGDDGWRFRFTGTRPGLWTYRSESDVDALNDVAGSIRVEPNPHGVGFVTHVGSKWARQVGVDGRLEAFVPQYVMYDTPDAYHDDPSKIDRDIQTFMVEHGFTGFHTYVFARWFDIDRERTEDMSADPNPDPRTFEALELLIQKVHAAGGVAHLWVWGDESRRQTPIKWGINGTVDKRLQRYIAARLGPLPGWTMGYGYDLWEWVEGAELSEWHATMQSLMGWSHMLGARSTKNTREQLSEDLIYASYEQHRPDYDTYVRTIRARPEKPSFSEDRFRIRPNSRYPEKDYDEERTRRGLWHSAMAGGVANIWGNLVDGAGSEPYSHPEWFRTYATFLDDRFTADLAPAPESVDDGYALRSADGGRYLFYLEDTDTLTVDLSGMKRPARAFAVDAVATYAERDLGVLSPGRHTLTLGASSDWAIAVGYR
ncbi:MAG: DUF5060 domain-containing protein [Candidatus Poribacteria bacterium]